MLHKLPFEVIKIDGFISSAAAPYMTYTPTSYSLHEEG